jgi:hypothetical protein
MNRKYLYAAAGIGVLLIAYFFFGKTITGADQEKLTAKVIKGDFEVTVFTTGELQAKSSLDIDGPTGMRI